MIANGKIITDIDIFEALETHRKTGAIATMVLKPNENFERFTDVLVEDGMIKGFGEGFPEKSKPRDSRSPIPMMFTGIQILEPRVFDYIPRGVYSDIVPTFYNPAIKKGETIAAHVTSGHWYELSTIQRYLDITLKMLDGEPARNVIGDDCVIAESANIDESIVWDNVKIERDAKITRSIIGDDVTIQNGEAYENVAIVRGDMLEHCNEIPEKALKGEMVGENYVVHLDQ